MNPTAILLFHCPDKLGIVAAVTEFVFENNGNIIRLDQHVDKATNRFFMRVEWEMANFLIPVEKLDDYFATLIARKFDMEWQLHFSQKVMRMAVFVSKLSHCLYDILQRYISGEWQVEIPLIISNHPDFQPIAEKFDIPYYVFPITTQTKAAQEAAELALLKEHNIDFLVLARYMQVLSDDFINHYHNAIINIHHSSLPAFPGSKPYHAAFERGVKFTGATAHYVTAELDAGPIISQGVQTVSHRNSIDDLVRIGKNVEKLTLSEAVWLHLQHRILPYQNKTIVFK
ncbi:MAG: formyltetrahydrofolate deformylase [Saprospiraceae bacterium]|nr:formyltetrahydrofolate deformylase [Saprospiraceae bacterium]MBP7679953.1 formyltetrahydrofolate deformylase [Saprospiraceae bacterium]